MSTPKPQGKANLLHQKILSDLIEEKPAGWVHKRIDPDSPDPKKPMVIETKVLASEIRFPLARNVSDENVNRAAERWAK